MISIIYLFSGDVPLHPDEVCRSGRQTPSPESGLEWTLQLSHGAHAGPFPLQQLILTCVTHWLHIGIKRLALMCTGPGEASSLGERGHVTAHLQVSRVYGEGWCALLRHEFSTRQHNQSHGEKQKGECGAVFSIMFAFWWLLHFFFFFSYLFCLAIKQSYFLI